MPRTEIVELYERHARAFDRDRSRSAPERVWLDRFLAFVRPGGVVLDLGCGAGEPIARYLIARSFEVVGVDGSPTMIEMCRARFPDSTWLLEDMRSFDPEERFDGVLAWDSFFHLEKDDQRKMFPRFGALARRGAPLMFTIGPAEGEAIGDLFGEPLYHASLSASEYQELLGANGFTVRDHRVEDPECGDRTVWLATLEV